jgi:hypothetical protein
MLELAVAVPTLIGSIASTLAAASVIFCYHVLPRQKHFRHTLIWNLAVADFINAFNNTTSGIYAISHGSITPGFACMVNGWAGQITVQVRLASCIDISIEHRVTQSSGYGLCHPLHFNSNGLYTASSQLQTQVFKYHQVLPHTRYLVHSYLYQ